MKSLIAGTLFVAALAASSAAMTDATATYQYDALGRVVHVTYSNGASVTYTYDAAGNRTQVSSVGGAVMVLPLLGGLVIPIR